MNMRMPPALVERAKAMARGDVGAIALPRPAATVVLVRDGGAGLEVLLMRRPKTMAFAPGMAVFPGGRVEAADGDIPVAGNLALHDWAAPDLSRAIVVAAARETFEEAGILLAKNSGGDPAQQDPRWHEDRSAPFDQVLARRDLELDADLLIPISHWITPEVERQRYDTRFLLAALPIGQSVRRHETETASADWRRPEKAMAQAQTGQLPMLPPTMAVLADLAGQASVQSAMKWAATVKPMPFLPRAVVDGEEVSWVLVHGYTGALLGSSTEPAGSEQLGLGKR